MTKKESDEGRNWGESNVEDKNRSGPAPGAHGIGEARANTPFPFPFNFLIHWVKIFPGFY